MYQPGNQADADQANLMILFLYRPSWTPVATCSIQLDVRRGRKLQEM